jgi:hypothetical protein
MLFCLIINFVRLEISLIHDFTGSFLLEINYFSETWLCDGSLSGPLLRLTTVAYRFRSQIKVFGHMWLLLSSITRAPAVFTFVSVRILWSWGLQGSRPGSVPFMVLFLHWIVHTYGLTDFILQIHCCMCLALAPSCQLQDWTPSPCYPDVILNGFCIAIYMNSIVSVPEY